MSSGTAESKWLELFPRVKNLEYSEIFQKLKAVVERHEGLGRNKEVMQPPRSCKHGLCSGA